MVEIDTHDALLLNLSPSLLRLLLVDKTTGGNIYWVTDAYTKLGEEYQPSCQILPCLITGPMEKIIRPRALKSHDEQQTRTRNMGEVFTPPIVCCAQNNLLDTAWFGHENAIFSVDQNSQAWMPVDHEVEFTDNKNWRHYVDKRVLEMACGEAPYLTSRYNAESGELIPMVMRMGLLDRKLRVVLENTLNDDEAWNKWSLRALEATYAFDLQGDNVLLARENLLAAYCEWSRFRNGQWPDARRVKVAANRIVWNVFQMDGTTYEVPFAQRRVLDGPNQLPGMESFHQEGVPCLVRDWRAMSGGSAITFRSLVRGGEDG